MTNQIKSDNLQNHYKDMILAVIPLAICGTVLYTSRVLLLCAVGLLTARAVDVLVSMLRSQEFDSSDYSSLFSALAFCMLLPVNVPLYVIIITVGLTTLVGKHLFGGKDVYPFNLTALAMCTAAVNWPGHVFSAVVPFSKVEFWSGLADSTISNAGIIKDGGVPYVSTFNMLLGNHSGVMGSDFILVICSVAVFLYATRRITWHIPVSFLATCVIFAFLFPRVYGFSRFDSVKFEMLNGALIFSSVFMMNEPATTPNNPKAKVIFGVLVGVLSMLFRYFGSYEVGVCFALLIVNTVEGFIDRCVEWKPVVEIKNPVSQDKDTPVPVVVKAKRLHKEKIKSADDAFELISEAEDSIDQVDFSTRTIDIATVLQQEALQAKKGKGGKDDAKL
ncbi:MAG: RnfABCDGE type electron transport complex subunit D [Oscillospiraceae bacterium]